MPVFALLSANAVSQAGNLMALVAVPWFVLQTTGSAAKTGLAGAAIALGAVLAGFLGGPVVDRLGFKRASIVADLASGVTVALIPLLHLTVGLAFWQLLALVFLGSVLDAPGWSARSALVPDLANEAGMPVERANSADQAIPRLSTLVGPPLAGVSIAALGSTFVLFLNAATFAVSAALVAFCVPSPARATGESDTDGAAGYFAELLEGLRFVRASALLLSLVLVISASHVLDVTLVSVVMPVYADVTYGSAVALGLMMAGHGAGALAGTVLFGIVGHRLPRRLTFIISFAAGGPLPYLVLAATPPLYAVVGGYAAAGVLVGPVGPLFATVIQERSPQAVRGRVFGVSYALIQAGGPIGLALGGVLIEGVGLVPAVVGMGAVYLAVTLGMLLNPTLRAMDMDR